MAGFLGISRRDWFEAFSTGGMSLILNKEEPMTKHNHHDCCEHDLEHCVKCDLAYCVKCSKEWGSECTRSHQDWTYTIPASTTTTDIPYTCSHAVGV